MYCHNCGAELPVHAKFCLNCGIEIDVLAKNAALTSSRENLDAKLVRAKCTGCGASLEVDARKSAAICPYCNSAYIVAQAINNYHVSMDGNLNVESATININSANVDNLLLRAKDYERRLDFEQAHEYYNKILDIDINNKDAYTGAQRTKRASINYVYFESNVKSGFTSGSLQLKKGQLVYKTKGGKEHIYQLDRISNVIELLFGMKFLYAGDQEVIITLPSNDKHRWVAIIEDAQNGKYPVTRYRRKL